MLPSPRRLADSLSPGRPTGAGLSRTHQPLPIKNNLGAAQFPTTDAGYRPLEGFITCHGALLRAGVKGTNSSGAGLTRHLHEAGIEVVEVIRPARPARRMRGKFDEIDA